MGFKQSVYDWCISNNRLDILDRWDYNLNLKHPNDISIYSKDCFYLICANGVHESSKFQIATLSKHNSLLECKYCLSFGHWCVINNRQDLFDRWDYDLNKTTPMETARTSPNKYYFKCPRGIHESSAYKLVNLTKYSYGTAQCKWCNSFAQWGMDNIDEHFIDLYWDYEKNKDIDPWTIPFRARPTTTIYIKCQ
jgi:transcription elongation factor Elf1